MSQNKKTGRNSNPNAKPDLMGWEKVIADMKAKKRLPDNARFSPILNTAKYHAIETPELLNLSAQFDSKENLHFQPFGDREKIVMQVIASIPLCKLVFNPESLKFEIDALSLEERFFNATGAGNLCQAFNEKLAIELALLEAAKDNKNPTFKDGCFFVKDADTEKIKSGELSTLTVVRTHEISKLLEDKGFFTIESYKGKFLGKFKAVNFFEFAKTVDGSLYAAKEFLFSKDFVESNCSKSGLFESPIELNEDGEIDYSWEFREFDNYSRETNLLKVSGYESFYDYKEFLCNNFPQDNAFAFINMERISDIADEKTVSLLI